MHGLGLVAPGCRRFLLLVCVTWLCSQYVDLTRAECWDGDDSDGCGVSSSGAVTRVAATQDDSSEEGGSEEMTGGSDAGSASSDDDSGDDDDAGGGEDDSVNDDNDDAPPTPLNCALTQVCMMVNVLLEQNPAAFDRFQRVLASLDLSELERSVRVLVTETNLLNGGMTTGLGCLNQPIALGPLLLLTQFDFTVLLVNGSGGAITMPVTLNNVTASVRFLGPQLLSFVGLQVDLRFDAAGQLVSSQLLFFTETLNNGAILLPEASPFPFPFFVQRCQLQEPLICGPDVVQPTDPPAVDIPDLPNALEADVGQVIAFLAQQRCPP
eukprot:scpid63055/ scgid15098/ 